MTDPTGPSLSSGSAVSAAGGSAAADPAPVLLRAQYLRDMQFRVPGAPGIYAAAHPRPAITLSLDVQVRPVDQQPTYEVTLIVRCGASLPAAGEGAPPAEAFALEFGYAGIFTLSGIPAPAVEPVLLAECPRLLFPFARNVLADVTREAGFPPVMLQPIDFVALWRQRRAAGGPVAVDSVAAALA